MTTVNATKKLERLTGQKVELLEALKNIGSYIKNPEVLDWLEDHAQFDITLTGKDVKQLFEAIKKAEL